MRHFFEVLRLTKGADKRSVVANQMLRMSPSSFLFVPFRVYYFYYKSYLLRIIAFNLLTIKTLKHGVQKKVSPQRAQKV